MKKLILIITSALCASPTSAWHDSCCTPCCDPCDDCYGLAFTVKNGFYYPQDCTLRNIFDRKSSKGGYWVEGAFSYNFWKGLNAEVSGSYFSHKGIALCGTECTEVKLPTFGLGLKYFLRPADWCDCCCNNCFERVSFFIGGGLRLFFYRERNSSPYVIQCIDKTVTGGMVNFGVEFDVWRCFFIDLFVDYNFAKLNLDRNDVCCTPCCNPCTQSTACGFCCPSCCYDLKLGGVVAGIGLGVKF